MHSLWLSFYNFREPLSLIIVQLLVIFGVLGWTPAKSRWRYYIFPIVVGLAARIIVSCHDSPVPKLVRSYIAGQTVGLVLQYLEIVLIGQWDIKVRGPTVGPKSPAAVQSNQTNAPRVQIEAKSRREPTSFDRLTFAMYEIFDFRGIGAPWQVKCVPNFSSSDPSWVPSRRRFLFTRSLRFAFCYLVLDALGTFGSSNDNAVTFSLDRLPLFRRLDQITLEEFLTRAIVAVVTWFSVICLLEAPADLLALLEVGTGISEPKDWPPIWDSPVEAYTVRRFWSPFYHQYLRRRLTAVAELGTYDLLGLKHGSLVGRYTFILLVFLTSGILHIYADVGTGMSPQQSGALNFFLMHFCGIVFEDLVIWLAGSMASPGAVRKQDNRQMQGEERSRPRFSIRLVGYLWLLFFMAWTMPTWIYPGLVVQRGAPESVVPVSILSRWV